MLVSQATASLCHIIIWLVQICSYLVLFLNLSPENKCEKSDLKKLAIVCEVLIQPVLVDDSAWQ